MCVFYSQRVNLDCLLSVSIHCLILTKHTATSITGIRHKYVVGSKSFRPDQLFKVTNKTTLLFFNIVSHYFNTLFNWYINLTIDGTIYPSQHFPFGAVFVCQVGDFWTLSRMFTCIYVRILADWRVNSEHAACTNCLPEDEPMRFETCRRCQESN